MSKGEVAKVVNIKDKILTIRGIQVLLDRDLAAFYGVETRALKQSVKRNHERFPEDFMFELSEIEVNIMVSQSVIPSKSYFGGSLPYAFTEHGVAMLSSVLKSKVATGISVQIMRSFVEMREVLKTRENISLRIDSIEKQFKKFKMNTDVNLDKLFRALETKKLQPQQGIFFDGQVFEAYNFLSDVVRTAEKSIVLIDNFIDDTVLTLFSKREKGVTLKILTKNLDKKKILDVKKFNEQFPPAEIINFDNSHDRFLIIDEKDLYHFGASLKDLGKKWFAFSKMDVEVGDMLKRVKKT